MEQREALEASGTVFVDIFHKDLRQDPLREVRRVMGAAGIANGDLASAEKFLRASQEKRKEKARGARHAYTLSDFGIEKQTLTSGTHFSRYLDTFGGKLSGSPGK